MTQLSDQIKELYKAGKTYTEIKLLLGCSLATISYHVGVGQKEKNEKRTRDRRSKIRRHIQDVKQRTPCFDCRENYPYWMMEFDHTTDDKEFNIGSFFKTTLSLERVMKEIEKCDIVCANCHRTRTYVRLLKTEDTSLDVSKYYTK